MPPPDAPPSTALKAIKTLHTVVWALLAGCVMVIPIAAWHAQFSTAGWLTAIVFGECVVLALNGGRCPLTSVAERLTEDRRANFDIYLPEWLAENNKLIFGALFIVGVAFTIMRWKFRFG